MATVQISVTRFLVGDDRPEWVEVRTKCWTSPATGDRLRWSVGYVDGTAVIVRSTCRAAIAAVRAFAEARQAAGHSNTGRCLMGENFRPSEGAR